MFVFYSTKKLCLALNFRTQNMPYKIYPDLLFKHTIFKNMCSVF